MEPAYRGELLPVEVFTECIKESLESYLTDVEHNDGFRWEVKSWDAPFFHPPAGLDVVQVYARRTDTRVTSNVERIKELLAQIRGLVDDEANCGVTLGFDCSSCGQKESKGYPDGRCWQCKEDADSALAKTMGCTMEELGSDDEELVSIGD